MALAALLCGWLAPRLEAQAVSGPAGAVEGRVFYEGTTLPVPTVIENGTDPEACGQSQSFEDALVSSENRGIQNVILALADGKLSAPPASPGEKLVLDNTKCRFQPHVAVLRSGGAVEAVNSDPIFHTTHLYSSVSSKNLSLHVGGKASMTVLHPGFLIVKCDIHGWMKAFIRVDNHPFHAVSDAGGAFRIEGIPAGSYTLEAWHERFGEQKRPVQIRGGETTHVEIAYRE